MISHFRPIKSFDHRFKYKQTQIGRVDNDSFLLGVALDCVFIFYPKYSSILFHYRLWNLPLSRRTPRDIFASDSGYQQASKRKPRHHLISGRRGSYKYGNIFNTSRLLWSYTFLWQLTWQTKVKQIWADTEESRDFL